ncbi:MAG TPA: zf-HC2 domain-containing protein [Acidimicrobiales bacterium]|nr:zf-HC2 domain-containing protein [Acidimicrobiales bacterium]
MNCDEARELVSAWLDGEAGRAELPALDEHLSGCGACRRWEEAAHALTRRVRLQPARPAPPPPAGLVEALGAPGRGGRWLRLRRMRGTAAPRAGLVAVALVQLALAVPALVLGHDRSAPIHVAHEMGSFDVAVGIGLLLAARRPGRAMGMSGLVAVAALLLVVTAAIDLASGRTTVLDEAPHLLVVAGWLLLRRLAMVAPPTWERPVSIAAVVDRLRPGRFPAVAGSAGAGAAPAGSAGAGRAGGAPGTHPAGAGAAEAAAGGSAGSPLEAAG